MQSVKKERVAKCFKEGLVYFYKALCYNPIGGKELSVLSKWWIIGLIGNSWLCPSLKKKKDVFFR